MADTAPPNVPNDDAASPRIDLKILSPGQGVPETINIQNVPTSATVIQLKERITLTAPSHPPVDAQRLIYQGHVLLNPATALTDVFGADALRQNRSFTLHMVVRQSNALASNTPSQQTSNNVTRLPGDARPALAPNTTTQQPPIPGISPPSIPPGFAWPAHMPAGRVPTPTAFHQTLVNQQRERAAAVQQGIGGVVGQNAQEPGNEQQRQGVQAQGNNAGQTSDQIRPGQSGALPTVPGQLPQGIAPNGMRYQMTINQAMFAMPPGQGMPTPPLGMPVPGMNMPGIPGFPPQVTLPAHMPPNGTQIPFPPQQPIGPLHFHQQLHNQQHHAQHIRAQQMHAQQVQAQQVRELAAEAERFARDARNRPDLPAEDVQTARALEQRAQQLTRIFGMPQPVSAVQTTVQPGTANQPTPTSQTPPNPPGSGPQPPQLPTPSALLSALAQTAPQANSTNSSFASSSPTVYLLSSPAGPHAVVFTPQGVFNGSLQQGAATGAVNTSIPSRRDTPSPFQVTPPAGGPQQAGAPHAQPGGLPNPPQALAELVQQARQGQQAAPAANAQEDNILGPLQPLLGQLWLLLRILLFAYFFLGGAQGWRRPLILSGICIAFFLVRGAEAGAGVREAVRGWWEGVIGLPARRADAAPVVNQQAGDTAAQANGGAQATQGNGNDAGQAQAEQNRALRPWRAYMRPVERALALFVASLWPGVGERTVRQRREEDERVQREQAEAEVNRAREQNTITEGAAPAEGTTASEPTGGIVPTGQPEEQEAAVVSAGGTVVATTSGADAGHGAGSGRPSDVRERKNREAGLPDGEAADEAALNGHEDSTAADAYTS